MKSVDKEKEKQERNKGSLQTNKIKNPLIHENCIVREYDQEFCLTH